METRLVDADEVKRLIEIANKYMQSEDMYDFRIGVVVRTTLEFLGLWKDKEKALRPTKANRA